MSLFFGGVRAVDGVDLDVEAGMCLGVVGGNGSGKSTLLDLLSGVARPTRGEVAIDGQVIAARPLAFAARGGRRTFQEPRVVAELSVDENIALGLQGRLPQVLGVPRSRRSLARLAVAAGRDAVGLDDVLGWWPAGQLSYGQRKRVELARLLVAEPRVALLDEPLAGVATNDRGRLVEAIRQLAAGGAAVVLVEHDASAVAAAASTAVRLHAGRAEAVVSQ